MEKEAVTSLKGADRPRQIQLAVRLLMVLAAAVAVAAFFLPWGTADEEYREAAAQMPDVVYYEPTGMTVSDAADLSLMEYAGVYHSMGSVWEVYAVIMYAILAASVLALLLAAMGKPIGAGVLQSLCWRLRVCWYEISKIAACCPVPPMYGEQPLRRISLRAWCSYSPQSGCSYSKDVRRPQ